MYFDSHFSYISEGGGGGGTAAESTAIQTPNIWLLLENAEWFSAES